MDRSLPFYFDFASPYAYFALRPLEALAAQHGLTIDYRPILLWAVFKAHGIASPMDPPAKRAYFVVDMARSAAFYSVPYRHPEKLTISSHLAARAFYAVVEAHPEAAQRLTHAIYDAFFVRGEDISQPAVVLALVAAEGLDEAAAREAVEGPLGRQRLAAAIDRAVADGVVGSPTVLLDGESFFGADRLPQLAWRLSQAGQPPHRRGV